MQNEPVYLGLDYHTNSIQLCAISADGRVLGNRPVANRWQEIVEAGNRFGDVVHVAIESCCGAADLAQELTDLAGWTVDLAHPGYVSRMKQNPDKSDYSDAQMLAALGRAGFLPRVWLAPQYIRTLRSLTRYRQSQANQRRSCKLRILARLRENRIVESAKVTRWTVAWMNWLHSADLEDNLRWLIERDLRNLRHAQVEIDATMRRLKKVTAGDPVVARLLTLHGVGEVTAYALRAEIGRFDRFRSGKQLSRFCGLSPCNASSGNRMADAGLIRAANPQLRSLLIEAAHRLKRGNPRWVALAARMKAARRPGSVIAAAVANRWVRWLYHEMNTSIADQAIAA